MTLGPNQIHWYVRITHIGIVKRWQSYTSLDINQRRSSYLLSVEVVVLGIFA
jgi:hypothetical protein